MISLKRVTATCMLLLSSVSFAGHHSQSTPNPNNEGFGEMVVFGGVFTDAGNFASVYGDLPGIFWENRFSNGPVITDYMAETLGLSADASQHYSGETVGTNYSTRNSWAGRDDEFSLSAQVSAYLENTQYAIPSDSLIVVWAGSHDVIEAISTPAPLPYDMIDQAVWGIETQLYLLIDSGAKHIFAPTFADVSFLPGFQQAGIADRVTEATGYYNKKYKRMLNRVERNTGKRIYRFEFDHYLANLVEQHAFFGLNNIQDACVDKLATGECNFNTYMFMTESLITSKTHKLIGDAFAQDLLQQLSSCKRGNWHKRAKRSVCLEH